MTGAISFRINEENIAKIYPVGAFGNIDWNAGEICPLGEEYLVYPLKHVSSSKAYLSIAVDMAGQPILRMLETKRYIVKIESKAEQGVKLPHFQNEDNKFLKLDKDEVSVIFQFVNYLGRSRMSFKTDNGIKQLSFEVIPDKMDYEDDYIGMTEALAEACTELLLEYSGATSNLYRQSDNDSKTLLEQFIFLRQLCYSQNIQSLFETIKRNPDRVLVSEENFKPWGMGMPAKKFFTNPFSYGRGWQKTGVREDGMVVYLPQEIVVTEKRDSLDTPANRFLKYAFERFDMICQKLIELLTDKKGSVKQAECLNEARAIHGMLDDIFRDSFFDAVGLLDIMPGNNQVLQKREGYAQIFAAYSMVDLALQLDWKGKDEVYEGESKNVALLYEYWLFFELYKIIRSIDGCETVAGSEDPFLSNIDGGITISLAQDKRSCQSFLLSKYGVKINLYYNRTFSYQEFKTTQYEGSYSRPFRPDYTIAIYPEYYHGVLNGENKAVKDGAVSYIHFDAKYRITDFTAFVGQDGNGKTMEEEDELSEDKEAAITNTYRRGDLLKMHTYNDAIRRTIGSYVLYPGVGNLIKKASYMMYDEILPGVGAFAFRPSNARESEEELKNFITSLIATKEKNVSRLNRLMSYEEVVLREPPVKLLDMRKEVKEEQVLSKKECIIGFIRNDKPDDYYTSLMYNNLLKTGKEFLFYFYAIKGQQVYSHHKDITRTANFRFYINDINRTESYELQPILCVVENSELLSKSELVRKLSEQGYQTKEENHHADFYYVLTVRVVDDSYNADSIPVAEVNAQNGNDTFSPHSPKIIQMRCEKNA